MARKYYGEEFNPAAGRIELRESHQRNSQVKPQNKLQEGAKEKPQDASQEKVREKRKASVPKTYVRYDEGAELYSMCRHTFMKLAAEAGAVYKINRLSLVNTKIFDDYLETFRVPGLYSDPMSYSRRGR